MLFSTLLAPLLATSVAAFTVRDLNEGEIAGLVENFKNAGLGEMVGGDNFKPQGLITGKFGSENNTADWNIGANVSAAMAKDFPSFFVNPAPNAEAFKANTSLFSAILVDAGPVGSNSSAGTLHWLINTIHVNTTGGAPFALNYDNGTTITEYAGPAPPAGSGPHRYVLGLFQQPENFTAPQGYNQKNTPVGPFDLGKYLSDSKLGSLVAANYFTVEEGTATASLSATSAVQSSTISGYTGAAAIPTAAGAQGGGGNGTNGNGTQSGAEGSQSSPAGGGGSGAAGMNLAPLAGVGAAVMGALYLVF